MRVPFDGTCKITALFGIPGNWACGWHIGIDLVALEDKTIYPIIKGKVVLVSATGAYGSHVQVKHENGLLSVYAHMAQIDVKLGQEVSEKTPLGREGSTGNSTGSHLHLEVHAGSYRYPAKNTAPKDCAWLKNPCQVLGIKDQLGEVEALANEKRYNKVSEMPAWAQASIQALIDRGKLSQSDEMDLSYDMVRLLVVIARML